MDSFSPTSDFLIKTNSGDFKMPSMHYHASYELYYLEAGSREYFVEDKVFSVAAGSFVLIKPGRLHRTGGAYGLRTLINFSETFLLRNYTQAATERLLRCFDHPLIIPPENVQEEFKRLLRWLAGTQEEQEFAVYLSVLLNELSKYTAEEESVDEYMSGIVEYINNNYSQLHTIEQIAEHFFISKYHLCRVFKKTMGMTLIDYLNQIRTKNACAYLKSSDKSILEISELCGFRSPTYFSNLFKKQVGMSPNKYRLQNK